MVVDFDNLSLLKVANVFEQDPSKFVDRLAGPKFNSRARLGEVKNLTQFRRTRYPKIVFRVIVSPAELSFSADTGRTFLSLLCMFSILFLYRVRYHRVTLRTGTYFSPSLMQHGANAI